MSVITAQEVYAYLEGYGIDSKVISDTWIIARVENFIVPQIKDWTELNFDGILETTEYYSGTGSSIIILRKKPVEEILKIELVTSAYGSQFNFQNIELIKADGIIKARGIWEEQNNLYSIFPRGKNNIKITYKYGFTDYPALIKEAILYLTCDQVLMNLANRTGGGSSSRNRNYGERGRYSDLRNDLARQAHSLLKPYMTGVIGT